MNLQLLHIAITKSARKKVVDEGDIKLKNKISDFRMHQFI